MNYKKYDINEIIGIPIREVAVYYNIDVSKVRGNKIAIKIRNEKTSSAYLYLDTNSWFDFGTCEGGDIINLVKYIENVGFKEAINILGERFNIQPIKEAYNPNSDEIWLSNLEWNRLGVCGGTVANNYDIDNMDNELYFFLNDISMNEYVKFLPESYSDLIKNKVIPYINAERQEYYKTILNLIDLKQNQDAYSKSLVVDYEKLVKQEYEKYEKIFKTLEKTINSMEEYFNIEKIYTMQPNLEKDYEKIENNMLMIEIGDCPYEFLNKTPGANKSIRVSYEKYKEFKHISILEKAKIKYPHAAFLKNNNVIIKCKEKDEYIYKKIFNNLDKIKEYNERIIKENEINILEGKKLDFTKINKR